MGVEERVKLDAVAVQGAGGVGETLEHGGGVRIRSGVTAVCHPSATSTRTAIPTTSTAMGMATTACTQALLQPMHKLGAQRIHRHGGGTMSSCSRSRTSGASLRVLLHEAHQRQREAHLWHLGYRPWGASRPIQCSVGHATERATTSSRLLASCGTRTCATTATTPTALVGTRPSAATGAATGAASVGTTVAVAVFVHDSRSNHVSPDDTRLGQDIIQLLRDGVVPRSNLCGSLLLLRLGALELCFRGAALCNRT